MSEFEKDNLNHDEEVKSSFEEKDTQPEEAPNVLDSEMDENLDDEFDGELHDNKMEEVAAATAAVSSGGVRKEIFEWIYAIAIAVIVTLVIRTFVFTLVRVDGSSMVPTLHSGDRMYVNRFMYQPEAGDIVVFKPQGDPDKYYVKRIIATEGQTVDIDFIRGVVKVDGKELDEPYINEATKKKGDIQFPVTVPEDCVFVLGDNRNNSRDSRYTTVGMVTEKSIMGEALFRLYPFNAIGRIH